MMKKIIEFKVILVLAIFLSAYPMFGAHSGKEDNLSNLPVEKLVIEDKNIHLTLQYISNKYKIPIGLEVSVFDDLLDEKKDINLKIYNATLKNVLNAIVRQNTLYSWKINNGVVKVFPKETFRDNVIEQILKTKIESIKLEKNISRYNFRKLLDAMPEIRKSLSASQIKIENSSLSTYSLSPIDKDFSLQESNIFVEDLFDKIIRESESNYWMLNRFGDKKEYLVINL